MIEFVKANGAAVVAASAVLLGAAIAGFFNLMGNKLNNNANRSAREDQFNLEKWKANRSLFLEKGEEALGLVTKLSGFYSTFSTSSAADLLSSKSIQISENIKDHLSNKEMNEHLNRLDSIVVAYFPDLISKKDELVKVFLDSAERYFRVMLGKADRKESIQFLVECGKSLTSISNDLKNQISNQMKNHL